MPFDEFYFSKDWTETNKDSNRYFPTFEPSEEKVREDLQLQPNELKTALNGLIADLKSVAAAGFIGDRQKGNVEATLAHLYSEVERVEGSITSILDKNAPDSMRSAKVDFTADVTADGWTADGEGYVLTIAADAHGRKSPTFGYQIWAKVDGVYRSDTWYGAGTAVAFDETDTSIRLTAEEPYAGRIAFFGI